MQRAWFVVIAIGCGSPQQESRRPPPPPPVEVAAYDPPPPALRLPRNFAPTYYTARLAVDPAKPTFDGEIKIEGNLDRRSAVIWLHGQDLAVASAKASDGSHEVTLTVTPTRDMLALRPAHPLDAGHWTLLLTYTGRIKQDSIDGAYMTKYGADPYIVTQFEAIAARLVFPCIDEPDRKTPWQLTLDVPKGQVAVSNTMPTGTIAIDATHERIAFAPTRPLPSYLVAFVVGPFEMIDAGKAKSGLPLRVFTPRGTTKKVAYLTSSLPKIVDALEAWFKIPYPYPKLDIVAVPVLTSAMENPGMITSDAKYVMFDNPGPRDRYNLVSVIGHETAHQWFGDLVTAAWWDDIWLNESFATYMEDKVLTAFDSTWPTEARTHRIVGFTADTLLSARKIREPIETVGDISNAFDGITYPKGATILRMIEHQIGEEAFQSAIQHYVTAHADGNATAADLFDALDHAGKPLGKLATGWVDQAGVPEVTMTLSCEGKPHVTLAQKRFLPNATAPQNQTWTIPVCVAFDGAKHERTEKCTVLADTTGELELPSCPTWFAPSGNYGYFRTRLEPKAIDAIRDKAWSSLTVDEHLSIADDAYMFALQGTLPLAAWTMINAKLGRSADRRELAAALGDTWGGGDGALGYPYDLEVALPADLLAAARAKARAVVEPVAKKLGFRPPPDVLGAILQADALGVVVWSRSHVLDGEARTLVAHYHDLSPDLMQAVLTIAANADPKVAVQLRADLSKEVDPVVRQKLFSVLGKLTDRTQHRAMIESLATDSSLTPDDYARMWVTFGDEDTRADFEAYEREHLDAIMKRLPSSPNEIYPLAVLAAYPITGACDPARRDEITAYVTQHFSSLPAAERPVKQFLEQMDNCIARKKLLEPSLRSWLKP